MRSTSESIFCGWGCPRRYWGEMCTPPERFRLAVRAVTVAARWEPDLEWALGSMVAKRDAGAIREWARSLVWERPDGAANEDASSRVGASRDGASGWCSRVRGRLHQLADMLDLVFALELADTPDFADTGEGDSRRPLLQREPRDETHSAPSASR